MRTEIGAKLHVRILTVIDVRVQDPLRSVDDEKQDEQREEGAVEPLRIRDGTGAPGSRRGGEAVAGRYLALWGGAGSDPRGAAFGPRAASPCLRGGSPDGDVTWFKLSDGSAFHAKIVSAGNEAWGAVCRAGAWSSAGDNLTDGYIPIEISASIARPRVWARARAAGLIEDDSRGRPGFQIHGFTDWNPTSSQVKAKRAATKERVAAWRYERASNTPSNGVTARSVTPFVTPPPARASPVPSRPVPIPDPDQSSSRNSNAREPKPVEMPSGLLALAQVLAAEGSGMGASVVKRAANGWLPTPKQRAALEAIRSEREAKGADVGAPPAPPRGPREPTRRELEAMVAEGDRHGMSPASFVPPPSEAAGGRRYHYPTPEELAVAGSSNGTAAMDEHEVLPTLAELATRR
jgi:hypothetical protein